MAVAVVRTDLRVVSILKFAISKLQSVDVRMIHSGTELCYHEFLLEFSFLFSGWPAHTSAIFAGYQESNKFGPHESMSTENEHTHTAHAHTTHFLNSKRKTRIKDHFLAEFHCFSPHETRNTNVKDRCSRALGHKWRRPLGSEQ